MLRPESPRRRARSLHGAKGRAQRLGAISQGGLPMARFGIAALHKVPDGVSGGKGGMHAVSGTTSCGVFFPLVHAFPEWEVALELVFGG